MLGVGLTTVLVPSSPPREATVGARVLAIPTLSSEAEWRPRRVSPSSPGEFPRTLSDSAAASADTGSDNRKSREGTASSWGEESSGRRAPSRERGARVMGACDLWAETDPGPDAPPSRGCLVGTRGSRSPRARCACIACHGLRRIRTGGRSCFVGIDGPGDGASFSLVSGGRYAADMLSWGTAACAAIPSSVSCNFAVGRSVVQGGVEQAEAVKASWWAVRELEGFRRPLRMPASSPPSIALASWCGGEREVGESTRQASARLFPLWSYRSERASEFLLAEWPGRWIADGEAGERASPDRERRLLGTDRTSWSSPPCKRRLGPGTSSGPCILGIRVVEEDFGLKRDPPPRDRDLVAGGIRCDGDECADGASRERERDLRCDGERDCHRRLC